MSTSIEFLSTKSTSSITHIPTPADVIDQTSMLTKKVLITGATGKQGGAVLEALIASKAPFLILALTRDASKAQALASKLNVTVIEGDVTNPASILEANKPIYGVFCVMVPGRKEGAEEAQAKPLIDELIKNGVEHFVFSSLDRGGPDRSEENPRISCISRRNIESRNT